MAATTEGDIIRDEQERNNLLKAIADVETAMAASTPGARRILENTLENAKKRVAALEKKIEEAKVEHQAAEQTRIAAAAALAAKETRLSADERETYRGFLEKPFFTKKDFGRLEEFYEHSYDRLSEGGKEEMSRRIDEGIKRGEFKFDDLPEVIHKKELQHRANKAGQQSTAQTSSVHAKRDASQSTVLSDASPVEQIDLSSVDLKGVKLTASVSEPAAASIPDASGQRLTQRA